MNTLDKFIFKKRKLTDGTSDIANAAKRQSSTSQTQQCKGVSSASACSSSVLSSDSEFEHFPSYWSEEQWLQKLKEHEWLFLRNGKLGCSTCKKVGSLGTYKSQGLKLSKEWTECNVSCFGDTNEKRRQSIRKKIFDHKNSTAHQSCISIVKKASEETIEKATATQEIKCNENTCRVFRTAYSLAKLNRPFTDFPVLLDLQSLNGLDVGRILQSDHSCADITKHISKCMKDKLIASIIELDLKVGIMIDESTTASRKPVLVICLRTVFPGVSEPSTFFFDLVELSDTSANTILDSVLNSLYSHGLSRDFLLRNLISFATDGASVMLGRKKGVATLLTEMFPNVMIWHCSNHRLELAVNDVIAEISEVNHMKHFFDKLYALYSASPKNQQELETCARSLSVRLKSIGRVLGIRWVASSARSVRAVWQDYKALVNHFEVAGSDPRRDSKEKATYNGLKRYLTDTAFVLNMGLLYDALIELEDLSLELQKRSTTLVRAHNLLKQKCRVFESMCSPANPGEYFQIASKAVEEEHFQGIALHVGKVSQIKQGQFFRSLSENMKARMLTTQASHSSKTDHNINQSKYVELLQNLEVLDHTKWPEDPDICFGDNLIRNLCKGFKLPSTITQQCIRGFRQVVLSDSDRNLENVSDLKPLVDAVNTLVVSTAECERAFSNMNDVLTPTRNSLSVQTVSHLVFLKTNGPPLQYFKPEEFVRSWIGQGRHHADVTSSRSRLSEKRKNLDSVALEAVWKHCSGFRTDN